ncbi:hypothetical protein ABE90_016140 [Escherichia coli]|nr:hypothetical protein ABE90_016140 [Escherichia coli]PBN84364.1 hypothetical protein ABE89_022920 [Escherichia coli]
MRASALRSKRPRRLACVGLGVFKEVLVVTGCCVPFLQNKITETIPNSWICPYISRHLLSLNPLQARCRRYSRGER